MRSSIKLAVLLIAVSIVSSGCATMRYPSAYKVEGKEVKNFKELDDDKALKLVALIYNIKSEATEDSIARSIALEEYLALLAKRNSKYIKKSGIFDIKYDKVKLSVWEDEELIRLCDALAPKTENFYMDSAAELTEIQNAQRIMYLTAINAIAREIHKRQNTKTVMSVASQVLLTALSAAMALI